MTTDDIDFGELDDESVKNISGAPPESPPEPPIEEEPEDETPSSPLTKPPTRGELSSVGSLLKETLGIFKKRFLALIVIILLASLLSIAGSLIAFIPAMISKSLGFISVILCVIVIIYVSARCYAALYHAISHEDSGIKESFTATRGRVLSFIWISLLQASVIIGGYFIFFIPGIILSVWLFPAIFIFINEDVRGMDSLLKSKEYVRGRGLQVFIRLFVSIIIVTLFGMIPIVGPLLSFLLMPFPLIFAYLLYKELKEIKGDFDFQPSKRGKLAFIVIAFFGPFVPFIVVVAMMGSMALTMIPMLVKGMMGMQNEMTYQMNGNNMKTTTSLKITSGPVAPTGITTDIKTLLNKEMQSFERSQAAARLGNYGDEKAAKSLIVALEKDDNWLVRQNAAEALGRLRSDRAVAALINTLEGDTSVFVKEAAARALGNINNKIAIGPLKKALKDPSTVSTFKQDGSYEDIRTAAIAAEKALKKMGVVAKVEAPATTEAKADKQTDKILIDKTNDITIEAKTEDEPKEKTKKPKKQFKKWVAKKYSFDEDLARANDMSLEWIERTEAIRKLGKSGKTEATAALVSALTKDPETFVRREAAIALGNLADIRAFDPLNRAIYDEEQTVREEAYAALQKLLEKN